MKKLLMLMVALTMTQIVAAIPAKRVSRTVTQPDGTKLELVLQGDETFHFYTTTTGQPMRQDASGRWLPDLRDVKALWTERALQRAAERAPKAEKMRRLISEMGKNERARRAKALHAPAKADEDIQTTKKGLLILVNFKDKKLTTAESKIQTVYNQILNSIDNPYGDNHGSVREYFRDQSYGAMDVTFDIKGPVTMAQNMEYYGKDGSEEGDDEHPGEMVKEALNAIKTEVNFADYDWDGDGEVENVYVIYAGYGQASGAPSNTIWPHQWALSEATGSDFKYNGITVSTYACGSELYGTSGSTLDGIGTMCHEYSHCLGLPDFYDTQGSNFGMSAWSIMDYGCYSDDGFCPAGYTAYERMYSGWLEPTELNATASIDGMKPIETDPEAYIIYNDANHNEYYLLANHQLKGWDSAAYGHGMLVLHVDYDKNAWENNTVNNTSSRQRMTIIPADGKLSNYTSYTTSGYNTWVKGLAGDPFPGTKGVTDLTDESSQKATLYRANTDGKKLLHKPITDISEANELISFEFMKNIKTVPAPIPDEEVTVDNSSFVASWGEVEGAQSYNLRYRSVTVVEDGDDDEDPVFDSLVTFELFEGLTSDDQTDKSIDLSSKLDEYTDFPGWTGEKVYLGAKGAKLGSSKAGGSLTSPMFDIPTGNLSLLLGILHWTNSNGKADNTTITVSVIDDSGKTLMQQTIAPNDEEYIELNFNGLSQTSVRVKIASGGKNQRFYMDLFLAFDGEYTAEEMATVLESDDEEDDDSDWDDIDWDDIFALRRKAPRLVRNNSTTYGDWFLVSDITTTHRTIKNLTPAGLYEYQVQAVDADGNSSPWSETKSVQLSGTVAVASVRTTTEQPALIYDLSGRRVSTATKPGIYIRNGKTVVRK